MDTCMHRHTHTHTHTHVCFLSQQRDRALDFIYSQLLRDQGAASHLLVHGRVDFPDNIVPSFFSELWPWSLSRRNIYIRIWSVYASSDVQVCQDSYSCTCSLRSTAWADWNVSKRFCDNFGARIKPPDMGNDNYPCLYYYIKAGRLFFKIPAKRRPLNIFQISPGS